MTAELFQKPEFCPQDLKGFKILGQPPGAGTKYTNLLYHLEGPNDGPWYLKVFTDSLHPDVALYDCASREILACRLGKTVSVNVPECYSLGTYDFALMSRDVGEPFIPNCAGSGVPPGLSEREKRDLVEILVFSHWVRDHERSTEHLVRGNERVWSIDYQCAGPGAAHEKAHLVQPHLERKIGQKTIPFDDLDRIGHFSGFDNATGAMRRGVIALQRLICDNYPEILEKTTWFTDICQRIESVDDATIDAALKDLRFFQQRSADGDNRIDEECRNQLISRRGQLRPIFERWIEQAKKRVPIPE